MALLCYLNYYVFIFPNLFVFQKNCKSIMSLFSTLDNLSSDQIYAVAEKGLNLSVDSSDSLDIVKRKIKKKLIDLYKSKTDKNYHNSYSILELWQEYANTEIKNIEVKSNLINARKNILKKIEELGPFCGLDDNSNDYDEEMTIIARDIYLDLFSQCNEKEKKETLKKIREYLGYIDIKNFKDQLKDILFIEFKIGAGSILSNKGVGLLSGSIKKQLTKDLLTQVAVIFGQKKFKQTLLAFLPMVGTVLNMITIVDIVSIVFTGFSYLDRSSQMPIFNTVFLVYMAKFLNHQGYTISGQ